LRAPFGGKLSLPAGSRRLEFHYTGLSYVAPDKVRFQVMLEGKDKDWQDAGNQRVAHYHDPSHGTYVFRVRAANNDGVWNDVGASLAVTVRPFVWQTLWFRLLMCAALVAVTAVSVWRLMRRKLRRQQQLLESQRALSEGESRFGVMADTAPVLIWMSGPDKLCTFFNKGWLDFTGRPIEQEMGNGWTESVHPEDMVRCLAIYADAFDARRPFNEEFRLRRYDGEYRTVLDHGVPRFAPDGAFLGYIGSALDITELRQSEAQVVRQRNELAHLSRVTMLGELSGSLAHELNQPLTSILSNAQAGQRLLSRDGPDLDEVREILKDIVEEDKRAGEVIRRLRLLLKKGEVQQQPLNLNEVVQDVLKLVRSDLINHDISMDTRLAPGLPPIHGDRVQLQQVLLNLVVNGCDAMTHTGGADRRLTVRTEAVDEDGSGVRVSVIDRGCGIRPESINHIFDPFYTTKPNGMGLGLAVCRTIISAHGGRLWAANNPDRGACVHIALPVIREVPVTVDEPVMKDRPVMNEVAP
jgi:PAS domain S-box-containing protein